MAAPSSGSIKEPTEKVESLVYWIAEILRGKNWVKKLLLLDVLIFVFLNTSFVSTMLETLGLKELIKRFPLYDTLLAPLIPYYTAFWWLLIVVIFLAALFVAIRTLSSKVETPVVDIKERSPIKGLRPFQAKDAEIFAKLQRQRMVQECLDALTSPGFRFGILTGESGSGKTSFLQAGLKPTLGKAEYTCVYVKFSDCAPVDSIRQAIIEQIRSSEETLRSTIPTDGKQIRLEHRHHELQEEYDTLSEKISRLKTAKAIETKPDVKFELEKHLEQAENERNTVQQELEEIERTISHPMGERAKERETQKDIAGADFLPLLDIAAEQFGSTPMVLIFDQFEQFFAHHKSQEGREPFVQAMAAWFKHPEDVSKKSPTVSFPRRRESIKILLSIRSDFSDHLYEFQEVMEYSLIARQNYIQLKRFTPTEATAIFHEIATAEQLEYDEQFVKEMTAKELASREDNLISPVDIQILALMLKGQKITEARALTRKAYQQLGGIEGLLERYLREKLEVPTMHNANQLALKVLLTLTDLDHNVRAGELTFADIQNALKEERVRTDHLYGTVQWLISLRLINFTQRQGDPEAYELAHERLIIPIRKVSGKLLGDADRANQLLDRRVNEWIGNNEHKRYLLNWRELRLLKTQKPYLIWGEQKDQKERLIAKSQKRVIFQRSAVVVLILIAALFAGWWYSPWGQIWQVRRELVELSEETYDSRTLSEIALAFSKDGKLPRALKLVGPIKDSYSKTRALEAVVEAWAEFGDPAQASTLLPQVLKVMNTIKDFDRKMRILGVITKALLELGDPAQARILLTQALKVTDTIEHSGSKVRALEAIAKAWAELGDPAQARTLLTQALKVTDTIEDSSSKAWALEAIAKAWAELGDSAQARKLLTQALKVTDTIENPSNKLGPLEAIAKAWAELGDLAQARTLLTQALKVMDTIEDSYSKARALEAIAKAWAELGDPTQALTIAATIEDSLIKAWVLEAIAKALAELGDPAQALKVTYTIEHSLIKAVTLEAIVEVWAELGDPAQAKTLLTQALRVVDTIENPSNKSGPLGAIAAVWVKLGNPAQALTIADTTEEDFYSDVWVLEAIAKAWAELGDPAQALTIADTIENSDARDRSFISISRSYATLGHWREARQIVEKIDANASKAKALATILTAWAEKKHLVLKE